METIYVAIWEKIFKKLKWVTLYSYINMLFFNCQKPLNVLMLITLPQLFLTPFAFIITLAANQYSLFYTIYMNQICLYYAYIAFLTLLFIVTKGIYYSYICRRDNIDSFNCYDCKNEMYLKEITGNFVDVWVLIHTILAILTLLLVYFHIELPLILFSYGLSRIFEIVIYQINVTFFDSFGNSNNERYTLIGYRRSAILFFHNYLEVILWFAVYYYYFKSNIFNGTCFDFIDTLFMSISAISGFGTLVFDKLTFIGKCVLMVQTIVGLFMTLVGISRILSLFRRPDTLSKSEK